MPRPSKHDPDVFLDIAAGIVRADGPTAITMSEIVRRSGAPSGSLYHRFPSRGQLLGALWLRTTDRFHGAVRLPEVIEASDLVGCAVDAAVGVVSWSRGNYDDACVLDAGRRAFDPDGWGPDDRGRTRVRQAAWQRSLTALIGRLHAEHAIPRAQVMLAVVDLPYGAVHRYLTGRQPLPRGLEDAVREASTALLAPRH